MSNLLIDEAMQLEPEAGPWKVTTSLDDDNWLVASFGDDSESASQYVMTDHVHASDSNGADAADDAAWVVWCRNHWRSILEALDANQSPVGTDEEKIAARRQLEAWNRGEPIRGEIPDTEITVFALQSQEAAVEDQQ